MLRQALTSVRDTVRPAVRGSRLLIVLKAAATATAAWFIGHFLPGDLSDYAYYAPLGVLVAITPTIASSFVSSVKALLGVLLGLVVAWALIVAGVRGPLALFLAIGFATLIAGVPRLGPGRDYIPFAAAFVFLSGGSEPDEFSVGLALQFALGAAMGVVVNLALPPPLHARTARGQLHALQERTASSVEGIASAFDPDAPEDVGAEWSRDLDDASALAAQVEESVAHVREGRRGNFRVRFSGAEPDRSHEALLTLQRVLRELREAGETLFGESETHTTVPEEIRGEISDTARNTAELLRTLDLQHPDPAADDVTAVGEALDHVHELASGWEGASPRDLERLSVVTYALRRIVTALG